MAENTTENMDEKIMARATELREKHGLPLIEAMLQAEEELQPKRQVPSAFTVEIPVKPRIARWIVAEFGGHPRLSIEDRLAAYLSTHLSRARIVANRMAEEGDEITEGRAVSLTRAQFQRKAPKE